MSAETRKWLMEQEVRQAVSQCKNCISISNLADFVRVLWHPGLVTYVDGLDYLSSRLDTNSLLLQLAEQPLAVQAVHGDRVIFKRDSTPVKMTFPKPGQFITDGSDTVSYAIPSPRGKLHPVITYRFETGDATSQPARSRLRSTIRSPKQKAGKATPQYEIWDPWEGRIPPHVRDTMLHVTEADLFEADPRYAKMMREIRHALRIARLQGCQGPEELLSATEAARAEAEFALLQQQESLHHSFPSMGNVRLAIYRAAVENARYSRGTWFLMHTTDVKAKRTRTVLIMSTGGRRPSIIVPQLDGYADQYPFIADLVAQATLDLLRRQEFDEASVEIDEAKKAA